MGIFKNILKYLFSSNKKEKKCDLAENKEKTFHPEVEKYRPTIDVLCYSLQIYHSLNEITKCIETLNKYPDVADKIVSDIKEQLEEIVNREKGTNGKNGKIPFAAWSKDVERKLNRLYSIIGQAADTHAFSTTCRLIGDKEAIELQEFLKGIKNGNLSQLTQEATNILIDKVCAWIKQNVNKYLYNTGDNDAYIPSCSGKMIEDLKNYIKEESK